ncbi:unnamed protein product [Musa acuminata subsp. malaccensis]|uniref:(wild Malaysian banana) hypothetical protein n=1 Tax=Musa acuminata subsp. malaccensis TaxID=214687 RepID=A0A804L4L3_MUSAM|nr:unnamed protein product [Musa acuminata subsp. malaccensis]
MFFLRFSIRVFAFVVLNQIRISDYFCSFFLDYFSVLKPSDH